MSASQTVRYAFATEPALNPRLGCFFGQIAPCQTNLMCALIAQDNQWVKVPPQEVSVCLCS